MVHPMLSRLLTDGRFARVPRHAAVAFRRIMRNDNIPRAALARLSAAPMDEVDTIILQNLKAIGTNVPDDLTRLKGLSRQG